MAARSILVIALFAVFIAACTDAAPQATTTTSSDATIRTGVDGVDASIADTSRLVLLNGDLTEIAFAIGAGDRVIGVDLTTTYPPEADDVPRVGLGRSLDAEAVIALEPTLVLGDTQVGPDIAITRIREAGIPVLVLQAEATLEGAIRKITSLGAILGRPDQAEELAASVQASVDDAIALAATADDEPRVAYVYVRGPETVLVFGNGMPTHFLIEAAGGLDAAGEAGIMFAENLSAEALVRAAPDVLIVPSQGYELIGGLAGLRALPGIADTPAGRDGRILAYDEAEFLGMGPRVGQALGRLVRDLHPDLEG